jgi:hypothetical protein
MAGDRFNRRCGGRQWRFRWNSACTAEFPKYPPGVDIATLGHFCAACSETRLAFLHPPLTTYEGIVIGRSPDEDGDHQQPADEGDLPKMIDARPSWGII